MLHLKRLAQLALLVTITLTSGGRIASLKAQYLSGGGEQPMLRRYKIAVPPLLVVYPQGHDSLARLVADYAQAFRPPSLLGYESGRPFPLVLRDFTPVSNGLVAWVPSRMELYSLTGGEMALPVPWLKHLVSHEIRHYAQMNALGNGPYKWLYYLLGEQSHAISSGLTPLWYFEGDAIYNESRLGGYGRSQSAITFQQYRTDLLTGNQLSYDQYINRSLRYHAPNHYHFGALMVEHGAHRYGHDFWREVVRRACRLPYTLFPFHFAIKGLTGRTQHQLFNDALRALDSTYRAHALLPTDTIAQELDEFSDERYPHYSHATKESIIWKRDFHHRLACYAIAPGKRSRKLYEPAYLYGSIRYSDTLAIWCEIDRHPIWSDVQYSNIRLMHLPTGRVKTLTRRQRAISPIILPGDSTVCAIIVSTTGRYSIAQLPMNTAHHHLDTINLPPTYELRELCATPWPDKVVVRAVDNVGAHLLLINLRSQALQPIATGLLADISNLHADSAGLYFSASHRFARRGLFLPWTNRNPQSPQFELLPLASYGVEDIAQGPGDSLLFASYTVNGYRIQQAHKGSTIHVDTLSSDCNPFSDTKVTYCTSTTGDPLPSGKPYHKMGHLIRIHSWMPFYGRPSLNVDFLRGANLGFTVLSQNTLGTLSLSAGYFYRQTHGAGLALSYTGIWPHVDFSGEWGGTPRLEQRPDGSIIAHPHRLTGRLALRFPARWNVGASLLHLQPSLGLNYTNRIGYHPVSLQPLNMRLHAFARLHFAWLRYQSTRDIYPPLGISITSTWHVTPTLWEYVSPTYDANVTLYLPGVAPSHSIRLAGYSYGQLLNRIPIASAFSVPNTRNDLPLGLFTGIAMRSASLQYTLPLAYPDLNMGSWVYLKRLYGSLGANYSWIQNSPLRKSLFRTVDVELIGNVILFRTNYELSLGGRFAISPFRDQLGPRKHHIWSLQGVFNISVPPIGNTCAPSAIH